MFYFQISKHPGRTEPDSPLPSLFPARCLHSLSKSLPAPSPRAASSPPLLPRSSTAEPAPASSRFPHPRRRALAVVLALAVEVEEA